MLIFFDLKEANLMVIMRGYKGHLQVTIARMIHALQYPNPVSRGD